MSPLRYSSREWLSLCSEARANQRIAKAHGLKPELSLEVFRVLGGVGGYGTLEMFIPVLVSEAGNVYWCGMERETVEAAFEYGQGYVDFREWVKKKQAEGWGGPAPQPTRAERKSLGNH